MIRTFKSMVIGGFYAAALLLPPATAVAQEAVPSPSVSKDTILILDASGSMWGQIDSVNKIVIAKDVVEGLVRNLPGDQRLGFVAYGHRKKGDCGDIQTLADVGAERGQVIAALRELSPKGKTPLTQSVQHAADALNYTENAANVILVSDGLETCDADPCALAKTLEENGLDFTVHVVGFDVTEEERTGLQCIADETGGQFLAADNADELTEALTQVAVVESPQPIRAEASEPEPVALVMKASVLSGGPQIQSDLSWKVTPAHVADAVQNDPVFTAENVGTVETVVPPGDYVAEAVWTGWRKGQPGGGDPKTGRLEFTVAAQTKVITVPVDLGIPVGLSAPAETPEGVPFDVTWTGPDSLGAYIHVNRLDDGPREAVYAFPAQRARDAFKKEAEEKEPGVSLDTDGDGDFDQDDQARASIGGPSVAGDYEVRYVLDQPRLILARKPLTVTDSLYEVAGPTEAPVSTTIEINWSGPLTDGDFVTLIEAGSETVFQNGVTARLEEGKPATLTTPAVPGNYEVRYILANGYTLYPGMQHVVQASAPINIVDVGATVAGPETAVGGSTIDVTWTGPADERKDDFISIVEPGAEKYNRDSNAKLFARDGTPLQPAAIRVPAIDGAYELVYVLQPGGRILSRTPITISRAQATVDAPSTVKVGQDFEVIYTGDAFKGDRIIVAPADTPDIKMWGWTPAYGFIVQKGETTGTVRGSKAIPKPGTYEVRYVTGLQHQVLTRKTIVVTE